MQQLEAMVNRIEEIECAGLGNLFYALEAVCDAKADALRRRDPRTANHWWLLSCPSPSPNLRLLIFSLLTDSSFSTQLVSASKQTADGGWRGVLEGGEREMPMARGEVAGVR